MVLYTPEVLTHFKVFRRGFYSILQSLYTFIGLEPLIMRICFGITDTSFCHIKPNFGYKNHVQIISNTYEWVSEKITGENQKSLESKELKEEHMAIQWSQEAF